MNNLDPLRGDYTGMRASLATVTAVGASMVTVRVLMSSGGGVDEVDLPAIVLDTLAVDDLVLVAFLAETVESGVVVGVLGDSSTLAALAGVAADLATHAADTGNPHGVTYAQVGADPSGAAAVVAGDLATHEADATNPHTVTAAQVGAPTTAQFDSLASDQVAHMDDTGNPHKVTAAQAGAPTTTQFDSLSFDLVEHVDDTGNPHGVSATQIGAPTSVQFSSLAGDLVEHVDDTGNPHGVTAAQVGALATTGGTLSGGVVVAAEGNVLGSFGAGEAAWVTAGNWYRIASASGRAGGIFTIADAISGGGHSYLRLAASVQYPSYAGKYALNLLQHSYFSLRTFTKARLVRKSTYDPYYLELYTNRTGLAWYGLEADIQSPGWTALDWTAGTIPADYGATEWDLNYVAADGTYEGKQAGLRIDGSYAVDGPVVRDGWCQVRNSGAQTGLTGATTRLSLGTVDRSSTGQFGTYSNYIETTESGWYKVAYVASFDNRTANRVCMQVWAEADGAEILGSRTSCYLRYSTYGRYGSCQATFIVEMEADGVLELFCRGQVGSGAFGSGCNVNTLANGVLLTVERV